ncbi:fibronectin type III domain-containing protein, partial [Enterococcus ratti]|uniref:fibronectin type III domain-containing protein n=1 Tax=Enterococcus ratti TaxID=150033 RepID=UPI0011607824
AKDQAGNISEASNQVHPRTSVEEENNEPLPPSELRAATVMEDKVVLMWQAADSNGISAYQVYRNDELVGEVPADILSYTDAGLTENTNYSYTVKSKDPSGNLSKASNLIVVQTSQKPAKKTPKQPSSDDPVNHTKNNTTDKSIPAQIINKVSTDKTLLDKLPLTGSRVHPALQIAGVVIVGGIAVVWFKRRKKS